MDEFENIELRRRVLLAFQVALLGAVAPHLRAVATSWDDEWIRGRFLFDGALSEHDEEIASVVEGEVISNFPSHMIQIVAKRIDHPEPLAKATDEVWVYRRME